MIVAGVKIMFLGMGIVFVFLIILICAVRIAERILARQTAKELDDAQTYAGKEKAGTGSVVKDDALIAVISAAITFHHESLRNQKTMRG